MEQIVLRRSGILSLMVLGSRLRILPGSVENLRLVVILIYHSVLRHALIVYRNPFLSQCRLLVNLAV
jgi:hypothetical protein